VAGCSAAVNRRILSPYQLLVYWLRGVAVGSIAVLSGIPETACVIEDKAG